MSRRRAPFAWITACLSVCTLALAAPLAAADDAPVLAHRAVVEFDLTAHRVVVEDEVTVPPGVDLLRLGGDFAIEAIYTTDNARVDPRVVVSRDGDAPDAVQLVDLTAMGLRHGGRARLRYAGTFHQSTADVVFSRENVGGEITATIGDEGIYLASSSGWLPRAEGTLARHELHIVTPLGFETVTQGERTLHQPEEGRLVTRWVAEHPSDGLNLIANRYVVHEQEVRPGVTSMTFLLEDDARLRATYMERTAAYLAMYEEMIGPYPYAKFATVENWFPTGYGMPSYTLLGGQVLRLPFIPYTSFGHEICHNWWGNSVFVDTDEGNWCEGLTSYCADYHYKELESAEAAREYRRTMLKDYEAYVRDPANDFALADFKARHSGATRAVGYGKSMMVFHMADRMLGRENFLNALRVVAADFLFREAAWSDFMAVFAEAGGRDMATFAAQWLTRTGAPTLALADVAFDDDGVRFTLRQDAPVYELDVPVVVETAAGAVEHVLRLTGGEQEYRLEAAGTRGLAVDPDYHLFRRLDPVEVEPTVSQVLGDEAPVVVTGEGPAALREAADEFAADWAEDEGAVAVAGDGPAAGEHASILLNPGAAAVAALAPAELKLAGGQIFLAGRRFARADYDVVFAAADPAGDGRTHLVVLCDEPGRLAGLASRISHYGKYSWVLLPHGNGRAQRGNWSPGDSPLVASRSGR